MGKIYDLTVNILTIEKRVETGFHSLLQCIFPIKNSLFGTKLETKLESLYEKIIDINNLKTFRLLERFKRVA